MRTSRLCLRLRTLPLDEGIEMGWDVFGIAKIEIEMKDRE